MQQDIFNHLTTFDQESLPLYRRFLQYSKLYKKPELQHQLLLAARQGDQQAQTQLLFSYVGMIMHCIQRLHCPYIELDELVDAGLLGVWHATHTFQMDSTCKFSTYCCTCVYHAITDCIREYGSHASDEENEYFDSAEELEYRLFQHDPSLVLSNEDETTVELLKAIIRHLPQRKAEIVTLLYGLGDEEALTTLEVAQRKGISHQRVGQLRDEAIRDLQLWHRSAKAA